MPRKTTIFIVILAVITGVLLYLAITSTGKIEELRPSSQPAAIPTEKPVVKTAELSFEPNELNVDTQVTSSASSDVMINSNTSKITGAQLEMSFDPKVITNISISPPVENSFFGVQGEYVILFQNVDYQNGRISFAIAINPDAEAKVGIGKVATITFTTVWGQSQPSEISFLDKTMVTEQDVKSSVLKSTLPLKLNFSSVTNNTIVTTPTPTMQAPL